MGGAATAEVAGPVRTCIGCRRRASATGLVRIVAGRDGKVRIGRTLAGRGAWLHPDSTCLEAAGRHKALPRALRVEVGADQIDSLRSVVTDRARIGTRTSGIGPEKGLQK